MKYITLTEEDRRKVQCIELEALRELDRICRKENIPYSLCGGTLLGAVRHRGFIPWDDDIDVLMFRKDYERFAQVCRTELDGRFFYQSHETDPQYFHLFNKIRVNGTVFKESFLAPYDIHHGVYIDIFPMDWIPDGTWKRSVQYYAFHFFRTGLMAKYLDIHARTGSKKHLMRLFRILYFPFPMDFLYRSAQKIATRYADCSGKDGNTFVGLFKKKEVFPRTVFGTLRDGPFEDLNASYTAEYDRVLTQMYGDYMTMPPVEKRVTRHDLVELRLDGEENR